MVAGLGTIAPASGFDGPGGAFVIGISAGIVCFVATGYLKRSLKIDDSLDVFPVHRVVGLLGTSMTAGFASNALGIFSGQEEIDIGSQFTAQLVGVLAVFIYNGLQTFIILKIVGAFGAARVTEENELDGLDIISHNERGYDL